MVDQRYKPPGTEPPPITYNNPRRTSPEHSVTLRHHRLAKDFKSPNLPAKPHSSVAEAITPRRDSSGESRQTGASSSRRWFDKVNQNPVAHMGRSVDADPPFFQKESDSSNEDAVAKVPTTSEAYRFVRGQPPAFGRPSFTHSSSADDYRSIVDDLTIENKRLREELKKYKQKDASALKQDKLFEVKIHGLPGPKKKELEATLRDFATSVDGSIASSHYRKRNAGKGKLVQHVSKGGSSGSPSSQSRRAAGDSAYASMSTGQTSSTQDLVSGNTSQPQDFSSESGTRYSAEGLLPRIHVLPENEKKMLVVRRLEQLFTGSSIEPSSLSRLQTSPSQSNSSGDINEQTATSNRKQNSNKKPVREAHMQSKRQAVQLRVEDHEATYDSKRGGISGSNTQHNTSPSAENISPPTESSSDGQRPTNVQDLDPDRKQSADANLSYIRHLGVRTQDRNMQFSAINASPDAEGWIYLNLLMSMAQLHILNVTPDFVRNALKEKSRKFQVSSDGRQVRWRGGDEGTRFSSQSSGSQSKRSQLSDETEPSEEDGQRKRQKTQGSASTSTGAKTGLTESSTDSFHYKPLFVHQQTSSSDEQPSTDDMEGAAPRLALSGNRQGPRRTTSGTSILEPIIRKKRREGAITYYSGAAFCTDLCGEPLSDLLQAQVSSGLHTTDEPSNTSYSPLSHKPLSRVSVDGDMEVDIDQPSMTSDETMESVDDIDADMSWSDDANHAILAVFEASGLGGITPEDHFAVAITTRRPKTKSNTSRAVSEDPCQKSTDWIATRLAKMTTTSPGRFIPSKYTSDGLPIEIEYVEGRVQRLQPSALPPPSYFYLQSSVDSDIDDEEDDFDDDSPAIHSSIGGDQLRQPIMSISAPGLPASESMDTADEADEESDAEAAEQARSLRHSAASAQRRASGLTKASASSVATAGGQISYKSSMDEDE